MAIDLNSTTQIGNTGGPNPSVIYKDAKSDQQYVVKPGGNSNVATDYVPYVAGPTDQPQSVFSQPGVSPQGTPATGTPQQVPTVSVPPPVPPQPAAPQVTPTTTTGGTKEQQLQQIAQKVATIRDAVSKLSAEQLKQPEIVGQTAQDAAATVKDTTQQPIPPATTDIINQGFANLQKLSDQYSQLMTNQPSMVETYTKLLADQGVTADKMELVNLQNVMLGSKDDIRTELMAAGAPVTESGIEYLAAYRNRFLQTRADQLSNTIRAKEDYIDQVVNLTGQDRKTLTDQINAQFGFTQAETQLQMDIQKTGFSQTLDYQKFIQSQQQNASDLIIAKAKSGALTNASDETLKKLSDDSGGKFSVDEMKSLRSAAKLKDQIAQEGLILANQIRNGINNANVQPLPSGQPNPVDQQKFLTQFSPYIQTQIKGVANYSINPADYPTYTRKGVDQVNRAQIVTLAQQYDPTYDDKQYPVRAAFLKAWTAGGQNAVSQAANTAIQHLGELKKIYDQIKISPNAGILSKKYADLQTFIKANENVPQVAQFGTIVNSLSGELAKIYKNGINSSASPTEIEEQNQQKVFSMGWGTKGLNGIVESTLNLMRDRLITASETYTNTMGKPPTQILLPTAQKTLDELKSKGMNVDFSGLDPLNNTSDSDLFNSTQGSGGSANTNNSALFNSALNLLNNINLQNQ